VRDETPTPGPDPAKADEPDTASAQVPGLEPAVQPDKLKPDKLQPNNPLHGVTLEMIVTTLVANYGWEKLGKMFRIRCFTKDPSIKSSLRFLRTTPWAREKVEKLYVRDLGS
jgi:hypothetical protein